MAAQRLLGGFFIIFGLWSCDYLELFVMYFFSDIYVALKIAFRARFIFFAFWLLVILCVLAWMGGQFSGRQPATVALDVGLSFVRIALPVWGVLILQELISRESERRYFLVSLTYPRPRYFFLLGRFCALIMLVAVFLIALAVALAVVVAWIARGYDQATSVSLGWPYFLTIAFIGLDVFVVLVLGVLLAVVASSPNFVLVGALGFMLVARSFAAVVSLLSDNAWLVGGGAGYRESLGMLSYFLPDLGALDVRMVALYNHMDFLPADWPWLIASSLAYAMAFLALAVWALNQKRFS